MLPPQRRSSGPRAPPRATHRPGRAVASRGAPLATVPLPRPSIAARFARAPPPPAWRPRPPPGRRAAPAPQHGRPRRPALRSHGTNAEAVPPGSTTGGRPTAIGDPCTSTSVRRAAEVSTDRLRRRRRARSDAHACCRSTTRSTRCGSAALPPPNRRGRGHPLPACAPRTRGPEQRCRDGRPWCPSSPCARGRSSSRRSHEPTIRGARPRRRGHG
jgi:hypothetical protein